MLSGPIKTTSPEASVAVGESIGESDRGREAVLNKVLVFLRFPSSSLNLKMLSAWRDTSNLKGIALS